MEDINESALSFSPVLERLVATGQTVDGNGDQVTIRNGGGISTTNNLIVLRNLQMELKPENTLEIGLAHAASALVFAQGHKDLDFVANGQHVAIDPFQDHLNSAGLAVMSRAGLDKYVTHLSTFSDVALPALLADGRKFGMIYVDGSHLFEDVFIDIHYSMQLLSIGGVMLLDDSADRHVAKALRFVRSNLSDSLQEMEIAPYRADLGRTLKYRVAKSIGRAQLTAFKKINEGRRRWDSKLGPF